MMSSVQRNCLGMLVHDFGFLGMNYEEISRKQQEMSSRLPRPIAAKHAKEKNMIASTATGRAREEEGRSMNDPDPRFLTRSPCAWIYKQNGR